MESCDNTSHMHWKNLFLERGFMGPVPLLEKRQAVFLARHLLSSHRQRPDWHKPLAAVDPLVYQVASSPGLLRLLRGLIGDDIILWGGSVISKQPGEIHPWHCDIETCGPAGGFVSVWIGLLNTRKESSLRLVRGSHDFRSVVQEVCARNHVSRDELTDDLVLRLANAQRPGAEIDQPGIGDGEALIFDGRIWHGSHNPASGIPRVSLLLQYARADIEVRVPDFGNFEWPFLFRKDQHQPVLAVAGRSDRDANMLVPPPSMKQEQAIRPCAYPVAMNHGCGEGVPFASSPCFLGRTDNAEFMECHYSVLMPGASPHPPHAHLEEEILVVMRGAAELVVTTSVGSDNREIFSVAAGSAVYYPSYQPHTIRNTGTQPVCYAMIKWKSAVINAAQPLTARLVQPDWLRMNLPQAAGSQMLLLEGNTAFLGKLHAHITRLHPGEGYAAHRDSHDVAIFLIRGQIAILGNRISAPAVVFLPSGCLHDMKSTGTGMAKYMVWEFHKYNGPGKS